MPPNGPGSGSSTATTAVKTLQAKTLSGRTINIPGDYRGQLVLLDFWATWCGPCRAEMPNVQKAYADFASQGLAIVGVSLDAAQRVSVSRVQRYVQEQKLPWEQIYEDGQKLAAHFGVEAIPAAFLIDGTTGKILAQGDDLRGPELRATLERHLREGRS